MSPYRPNDSLHPPDDSANDQPPDPADQPPKPKLRYTRPLIALPVSLCLCVVSIMVGFISACGPGGGGYNREASPANNVMAAISFTVFVGSALTFIGSTIWIVVIAAINSYYRD